MNKKFAMLLAGIMMASQIPQGVFAQEYGIVSMTLEEVRTELSEQILKGENILKEPERYIKNDKSWRVFETALEQAKMVDETTELIEAECKLIELRAAISVLGYNYEAENGVILRPDYVFKRAMSAASGGYVLDGFVKGEAIDGSGVEWELNNLAEGKYQLRIYYARDTYLIETDSIGLYKNTEKVQNVSMPSTGGFEVVGATVVDEIEIKADDKLALKVAVEDGHKGMYRIDGVGLFLNQEVALEKLVLQKKSMTVEVGKQAMIGYKGYPSMANAEVVWESTNPEVAKVEDGKIIGIAEGKTTISIKSTSNNSLVDQCEVTVKPVEQGTPFEELQIALTEADGCIQKSTKYVQNQMFKQLQDLSEQGKLLTEETSQDILVEILAEIRGTMESLTYWFEAEDEKILQGEEHSSGPKVVVKNFSTASGGKALDGFIWNDHIAHGSGVEVDTSECVTETGEYEVNVQYARSNYLKETEQIGVYAGEQKYGDITLPDTGGYEKYTFGEGRKIKLNPEDKLSIRVDKNAGHMGLHRLDGVSVKPIKDIQLNKIEFINQEQEIQRYEELQMIPKTYPSMANTPLLWESSNEEVAIVKDGILVAIGEGVTTITVTSKEDIGISASCEVKVVPNTTMETISSEQMSVTIDKSFPRVIEYRMNTSGNIMKGNKEKLDKVLVNGIPYTPTVEFVKNDENGATYQLKIEELEAVITMTMKVEENTLKLDVTEIQESKDRDKWIYEFDIPNHRLVTVSSKDEGAALAGSNMQTDITKTGDTFLDLTKVQGADSKSVGYRYAFINNNRLAAGIRSNGMNEWTTEGRIQKQTVKKGEGYETSLWSGGWIYRQRDYTKTFVDTEGDYGVEGERVTRTYSPDFTEDLPLVYVAIAEDENQDKQVNWQDGAIAYRKFMVYPKGWEEVQDAVVQRLVFPQSGEGNWPYLATLDETRRVYQQTDGIGQLILHKYHNAGTWGDFSVYDDALGGLEDFRTFVKESTEKYNSYVGIHTNFTEVYAKATDFRPEIITEDRAGFGGYSHWLQQVYVPDRMYDAVSQERLDRLKGFKADVPELGFIYSDVYSADGWLGRRLAEDINEAGFGYVVEWPYQNEEESPWSHWAVEKSYSPMGLKAYSSDIARFIFNHTKDRWDNNTNQRDFWMPEEHYPENDPYDARYPNSCNLLMGADTTTYEGWIDSSSNANFNYAITKAYRTNLPTKYMQHFPILKMEKDAEGWAKHIWFEDNIEVYYEGNDINNRIIKKDGKTIYTTESYLIPWEPETEEKLYHWNEKGGMSEWELPNSWGHLETVYLYELTDNEGKVNEKIVPVVDGKIKLENIKEQMPYVIYQGEEKQESMQFGEGSIVLDGGFNSGTLKDWDVKKGNPQVKKNDSEGDITDYNIVYPYRSGPYGQQRDYELIIDNEEETEVSQVVTGLAPGRYAASVMVEVEQGKERRAQVSVDTGEETYSNYADSSILYNYDGYDSKVGTYTLRMRVDFVVPEGSEDVTIRLNAEQGDGKVRFDNIRIFETELPIHESTGQDVEKTIVYQDFEYAATNDENRKNVNKPTYEGYYPFNLGGANNLHETRCSIQKKHDPYTQNGADNPWDPEGIPIDDVIDGMYGLKMIGVSEGVAMQTIPQTVRFEEGKKYRVTFQYETQPVQDYAFVIGDGQYNTILKPSNPTPEKFGVTYLEELPPSSKPVTYTAEFTATSDQNWIGIYRTEYSVDVFTHPAPFVIDNILIEELKDEAIPQVGSYTVKYQDETGKAIAPSTFKTDLEFGTYEVEAVEVPNYTVKGNKVQSVTLNQENAKQEIIFVYETTDVTMELNQYTVSEGKVLEVRLGLGEVEQPIYAQDLIVKYDPNLFELLDVEGVNDKNHITYERVNEGEVRILVATEEGLTSSNKSVKLSLQAKRQQSEETVETSIEIKDIKFGVVNGSSSMAIDAIGTSHSVEIQPEQEGIDKSILEATINKAQQIVDEAVIGTKPGEYPQQAKEQLVRAIAKAKLVVENSIIQEEIDQAVISLNQEIEVFKQSKVKDETPDINEDGVVNVADLALIAYYYQTNTESENWLQAQKADYNKDGLINLDDLVEVAIKILE